MAASVSIALILVATSILSALAALALAAAVQRRGPDGGGQPGTGDAVFLIDDHAVIDANARGRRLLATLRQTAPGGVPAPEGGERDADGDRDRLMAFLLSALPTAPAALEAAGQGAGDQVVVAPSRPDMGLTVARAAEGVLRLSLRQDHDDGAGTDGQGALLVDRLSWRALTDEVEQLRRLIDLAPTPAWRENDEGQVIWANGAYLRLLHEARSSAPLVWPLPALFEPGRGPRPGRTCLALGARGRPSWFDLVEIAEGEGRTVFALPADEAHRAERTRREFVQTLTKTFATLPIGLAVFDRTRRLQMFNPALTDLTRLEPEFLASRPGLEGFLNRMRDKHILPEPRDYRAWSRRLLDVESAGSGSGMQETWPLADGRTFRVSATPHPDGALAFLIEDITAEVRLKRSFRAELDTGQVALDMVETALAMFSPAGDLVMTNAAFDRLWTLDGAETLTGVQFREAVANWRAAGDAPELWDRIAALGRPGTRDHRVEGNMQLPDGEEMRVCARLAPTGGVMLAFQSQGPAPRRRQASVG